MERLRIYATFLVAAGMFSLAAAIVYFTYSLIYKLPEAIPELGDVVEAVEPVIAISENITLRIPEVLAEVKATREQIPAILEEVNVTREQIPAILEEIKAVRESIPSILEEWNATRTETLPAILSESEAILAESEAIRATLPDLLEESAQYRQLVPDILNETQNIRETIPPTLDRIDDIVAEGKTIATTAGENAVSGVVTGIIKSPFKIASSLGGSLLGSQHSLSSREKDVLRTAVEDLVNTGNTGSSQSFASRDGRFTGTATIISDSVQNDNICREVLVNISKSSTGQTAGSINVCMDQNGTWSLVEK